MTDGDGYKYTFTVGEFTRESYSDGIGMPLESRVRQWKLEKITAPNGNAMEFIYSAFPNVNSLDLSDNEVEYMPSVAYEHSFHAGVNKGYGSKKISIYRQRQSTPSPKNTPTSHPTSGAPQTRSNTLTQAEWNCTFRGQILKMQFLN
nr:unnamed protein product [uncultured bacterium]